jgi:hypothetical protein
MSLKYSAKAQILLKTSVKFNQLRFWASQPGSFLSYTGRSEESRENNVFIMLRFSGTIGGTSRSQRTEATISTHSYGSSSSSQCQNTPFKSVTALVRLPPRSFRHSTRSHFHTRIPKVKEIKSGGACVCVCVCVCRREGVLKLQLQS